jgi:hypothetical protein
VRVEGPQHLKCRREDPHNPIVTPKEETFRSRAYTAYFIVFEEGFTLIIGSFDLADVEEIEGFPLFILADFHDVTLHNSKHTEFKAMSMFSGNHGIPPPRDHGACYVSRYNNHSELWSQAGKRLVTRVGIGLGLKLRLSVNGKVHFQVQRQSSAF